MKKTFTKLFAGASLALTIVSHSCAQGVNSVAKPDPSIVAESDIFSSVGIISAGEESERRNELNAKAVRKFTREYADVQQVKWTKAANGYNVASFTKDGVHTWVFYAKKGEYLGRGSYYTEEKLPADIRRRVKGTYYDFSIYHITEVYWNDKLIYLVSIKDETAKDKIYYKIIRVVDGGEMDTLKEFSEETTGKN